MDKLISLHLGQPGMGMTYDPHLPKPYPIHVNEDGRTEQGPQTDKKHWHLIGFQPDVDTQRIVLTRQEFLTDIEKAVGLVPVFSDGEMFSLDVPVTAVSDHRGDV